MAVAWRGVGHTAPGQPGMGGSWGWARAVKGWERSLPRTHTVKTSALENLRDGERLLTPPTPKLLWSRTDTRGS